MSAYTERHARSFGGWLVVLAVSYGVLHHAGTIFVGLGEVGETRWADWIDLLTPYAVTGDGSPEPPYVFEQPVTQRDSRLTTSMSSSANETEQSGRSSRFWLLRVAGR